MAPALHQRWKSDPYWTAVIVSTSVAIGALGCRDRAKERTKHQTEAVNSRLSGAADPAPLAARSTSTTPPNEVSLDPVASASVQVDADAGRSLSPDEFDLGTTAPMALGSFGCAMVGTDDEVLVRRFVDGRVLRPDGEVPQSNAPWPAVADGSPARLYWITRGRLVRRTLSVDGAVGPLEVLASDAADFTRVSVASAGDGNLSDVVLYIGQHRSKEGERRARVWVEGKGARTVTPEGAGATSVNALSVGPNNFALLSLDGRLAVSPVHARMFSVSSSSVNLGDDRVVHVAGPAESQHEIAAQRVGSTPVVFVAMSRDTSTFGLLSLQIESSEREAVARWLMYPNGLYPALVATGTVCGKPAVAFVRPEDDSPNSRKAIYLGFVDTSGAIAQTAAIATAAKIRHLVIAPVPSQPIGSKPDAAAPKVASLLAYSTDTGLKARPLVCR